MKLCFFNRHAYSLFSDENGPVGGAERAMSNLARTLAQREDVQIDLVTQANSLAAPTIINGVRIVPLRHVKRPFLGLINKRPDQLAKFLIDEYRAVKNSGADVICVSQAAIETMVVYAAARRAGIPIVYRIASNMELDHTILRDTLLFRREWLARHFERLLTRFDAVVAQTPEQAAIVKKRFGRDIPVISNMLTMTVPDPKTWNPAKKNNVLWVGRSHPMKRPEVFFDLARRLPHIRFTAVITPAIGEAAYMAKLTDEASRIANIKFIPGLPPEQMPQIYASARVFLLTSESEGFPNVMAEAMGNGAPCLSTLLNPSKWLNTDFTVPACGYICTDDITTLAQTTERLMTDTTLWHSCALLAQQKVIDNMMPQTVAEQYHRLFCNTARKTTNA